MRISEKSTFILILIIISVVFTSVYAADALYRFMHNDHDALAISAAVVIGGADGPTSIYVSGNPRKAWIIPVAMVTIGAILGYFIKVKRRRR